MVKVADELSPLVILAGPTGSGKTALSLVLAREFGGEIVSCDSVAVYRGLEIGAAKPTEAERREIPHHLLDVADLEQSFTAGDYARAAREAIAGIRTRGRLPIVTGGSGLYLRALLEGLFPGPRRSPALRERLSRRAAARGPAYVHRMLARLDSEAAERIHPHDLPKAVRAIEVRLELGQPMSQAWEAGRDRLTGYRILRIGLDPERKQLYERLDRRARQMFETGLIEETAALLQRFESGGASPRPLPPALGSLGYRQVVMYLHGEINRDGAMAAVSRGHRNYAKRQMTWFRRESEIEWLPGFGDDSGIQRRAAKLVADAFGKHASTS